MEYGDIAMYTLTIRVEHTDPDGKLVTSEREATITIFRDAVALLMGATSAHQSSVNHSHPSPNTSL